MVGRVSAQYILHKLPSFIPQILVHLLSLFNGLGLRVYKERTRLRRLTAFVSVKPSDYDQLITILHQKIHCPVKGLGTTPIRT